MKDKPTASRVIAIVLSLCATAALAGPGLPSASAITRRPDLVVRPLSATEDASGTISITQATANVGRAGAGASTTTFFVSTDLLRDDADIRLTVTHRVARLKPRKLARKTLSVARPSGIQPPYFVIACADFANKVRESNEKNNCISAPVFRGAENEILDLHSAFESSPLIPEQWRPALSNPAEDAALQEAWPEIRAALTGSTLLAARPPAPRRVAARHGPPADEESTEFFDSGPVSSGSSTAQVTGTVTDRAQSDRLMSDSEMTTETSGTDPESGAEITKTVIETRSVDLGYCPDAAGLVHGTWSYRYVMTMDVSLGVERMHSVGEVVASGTVVGRVNDAAELTTFDVEGTVTNNTEVQVTATDGSTHTSTETISGEVVFPGRSLLSEPYGTSTSSGEAKVLVDAALSSDVKDRIRQFASTAVPYAIETAVAPKLQMARSAWRSGRCVELVLDVKGDTSLKAGESVKIVGNVIHRHSGDELAVPIEGNLGGPYTNPNHPDDNLVPEGEPLKAPATFTYTAPAKGTKGWTSFKNNGGEAFFTTKSKRGSDSQSVKFTASTGGSFPETWTGEISGSVEWGNGTVVETWGGTVTFTRYFADADYAEYRMSAGSLAWEISGTNDSECTWSGSGTLVATGVGAVTADPVGYGFNLQTFSTVPTTKSCPPPFGSDEIDYEVLRNVVWGSFDGGPLSGGDIDYEAGDTKIEGSSTHVRPGSPDALVTIQWSLTAGSAPQ